ncbi:MAG: zinc ribbon domain-containing protein [Kiritimatiellaeota bacterium]|nr:zinc ribbon domain-containing protein [Kiritimatiellota bacterium]
MPIYEYQCHKCGATMEKLVSRSDAAPGACPQCGAKKLEKQLSTFSASVARTHAAPCDSGACPAPNACASAGCGGGTCPYSGN